MPVNARMTQRVSVSRRAAFEVLQAVAKGEYASDALRQTGQDLAPRDAGLASQIVFGCLRYQAQLDYLIFRYSGRKVTQLDLPVVLALRSAIFQLRYLDRVPPHAAVHEAVEQVKQHKRAATGLANAVLRKVNRTPIVWLDAETEFSCPGWLLSRWREHFGAEAALRIAKAALEEPVPYIRISPGAKPPETAILEPSEVAGAFRLLSPLEPGMRLHDISSQAIVPLLDLDAGHTYLDLCAAPGNKTLQALETPLGLAVACDVSAKRLQEVPNACPRVVLDATRPLPFGMKFDRIFIDAPCSGTGTLGRNPEIKWRVQEPDFARFRSKQSAILGEALRLLKPGGKLVYATCSLEREENEDVVQGALRTWPTLVCEADMWRVPGREAGDGFYGARLRATSVIG